MKIEMKLGAHQAAIDTALANMAKARIAQRIWEHDHTVWKPDPDEIGNRLGWLHSPEDMQANLSEIHSMVSSVQDSGYTHVLLLGMGGSSLAPEVFSKTFGSADGFLQVDVLDSTDPGAILSYAEQLDLSKTLFIVATKSGGTVETLSFFKYFYNRTLDIVGADKVGEHFIAITDPGSKLVELAERYNFRHTFENDPNIGGRYAALSYFGLVPAALLGIDIATLLENSTDMATLCKESGVDNPGLQLGATMAELAKAGRDKLTFLASPAISSFVDWVEQLIAESTGKEDKGILPVAGEALGAIDVYGKDRVFVALELSSETIDTSGLEAAGHPVIRLTLDDVYDLGGQYFLWEFETAVAGHSLNINPFDQPNVESAKVLAREMVDAYQNKGKLPEGDTQEIDAGAIKDFLNKAQVGDYISIHAYVTPNKEASIALEALQAALRDKYRLATTVGYGPRFLHSTGQFHKGDAGNGIFIQLISDAEQDVDIPTEAGVTQSDISFGVLKQAQALGDAQALRAASRRVLSILVNSDSAPQIIKLAKEIA